LMGRGIVEPVDEMDNTPWNAGLLDWMAADFIDSGNDLKHLMRTIMTSKTYQLPTVKYDGPEEIKSKEYVFAGPLVRRMSAEQFSDAVSQVIAPMYYATAYDPSGNPLSSNRIWHREVKFERDVLPDPGKRYFRYEFAIPQKEIRTADALISVDHSYTLYVNGKKISSGDDWEKVEELDIKDILSEGNNVIAIEGTNEGDIANPAGILFALKLGYADGTDELRQADKTWKSTAGEPPKGWTGLGFKDNQWINVRDYGSSQWDQLVDFSFEGDKADFARAGLARQNEFMKALGRPTRENVATTRDEQATLLQALELTNGEYFNNVLAEGADQWLERYSDGGEIVETLYQKSFGRKPTKQEKSIALSTLGVHKVEKEALQDLLWTTVLLPEFQFIY